MSSTRSTRVLAAVVLARSGDTQQAEKMAAELQKRNPLNTKIIGYWVPTIRAAVELNRHNPGKAIDILEEAAPYELGTAGPQPEFGAMLYPVYLRGQAYLALHQGSAASSEFQKFLDHRGVAINSLLAGLAPLGIARAYSLQGAETKARGAYQSFLVAWTAADPDVPILKQAKTEYAGLR